MCGTHRRLLITCSLTTACKTSSQGRLWVTLPGLVGASNHNQQAEEEFERDAQSFTNKSLIRKIKNNILISFVLKCAPISSYLHSSEAAAPVWIPAWKNFAASPTNSQRLYAPSRQHLRAGRRQTQMSLVRDSKPNLINSISTSKSNSLSPPAGTHNRLAVCRHVRPADRSPRR